MKNNSKRTGLITLICLLLPLLSFSTSGYADGGFSLSQTRVVFDGSEKSTKVTLNNKSERVYLVNSRVSSTPDVNRNTTEAMPFIVTPPLFRLEKESSNTIMISKSDTSVLPKDRESVYYMSFLAIPSVKKSGPVDSDSGMTSTQVSFGIRTVIKLFYRPEGLLIPASTAPEKLKFAQQGSKLIVNNPTPYFITLAQLSINDQNINVRDQGAMIAPYSEKGFLMKAAIQPQKVEWAVINDFGGVSEVFKWSR